MGRSIRKTFVVVCLGIAAISLTSTPTLSAQAAPAAPVVPAKKAPVAPAKPAAVKPVVAAPAKPVIAAPVRPVAAAPARPVVAAPVAPAANVRQAPVRTALPVTAAKATAANTVVPATTRAPLSTVMNAAPAATSAASSARSSLFSSPATSGAQRSSLVNPADPRSAVAAQGVGTFLWGDVTLTAYGCFRTGTRVLCDYDVTKRANQQLNAAWLANWGWVNIVDDGGKITPHHNAFFMAADGSQMADAYITSDQPVRFVTEYADVSPNFNSVSLVHGSDRIQAVPISDAAAAQPGAATQTANAAPGDPAAQAAPGTAPAQGGSPASLDSAANTVSNVSQNVQDKKAKAKSFLQQMKDLKNTATQK